MILEFLSEYFGYVYCSLVFAVSLGSLLAYLIELGDSNWN